MASYCIHYLVNTRGGGGGGGGGGGEGGASILWASIIEVRIIDAHTTLANFKDQILYI